ncbi:MULTISPECIES: nucleotide exchange factor GrpE [unclassified Nocardiopsis]|jgi:molecular chaperone GrpE|uniref:nucleotide exchange factor GrpE n=1 Tax=unclassified Nocardiopsis TaxID=2649073 RepID=UPI00066C8824|nr:MULTISPECIES: nucleotide exchange factor GrpE [unclassified Nocardiopsis]MBQ1082124.1 nucleotide exchange factor GrpE [Nocardiopsis sp. B62]
MAPSDKDKNNPESGDENQGPVIRDNRKVDPETGEARTHEGASAEETTDSEEEPEVVEVEIEDVPEVPDTPESVVTEAINADERVIELTNDIKRVQAEYANYRKRVERDRVAVREVATTQVVGELLPILDDIGRAREHDELNGGFKAVGEALEATATKLGLEKYAEQGDEFDPNVHEALTLVPVPNISVQTVIEVFQPGYRMGERVLRPARVVVGEPLEGAGDDESAAPSSDADDSTAENGEDKQ